jgi:hypothetical protein
MSFFLTPPISTEVSIPFKRSEHYIPSNGVHLMVDLETLGTTESAPILTIGAVLFDPQARDTFEGLLQRAFLRRIEVPDAIKYSGGVNGETLKWWFQQSDAAIKALVGDDAVLLKTALTELFEYAQSRHNRQPEWLRNMPLPTRVWAKDPDFDCNILRYACDRTNIKWPYHFSIMRSVRTIQDTAFPDGELPVVHEGVAHDAAQDAVAQALMVQACYAALGQSREQVTFIRY